MSFRIHLSLILSVLAIHATAQTITRKGTKFGLNDKEGAVVLEPVYDLVKGPVWNDIYIAAKGNKYAYVIRENSFTRHVRSDNWVQSEDYVDSVRWKISAFDFDEIYPLTTENDRTRNENERYMYKGRNCHSFKRKYYILGYSRNNKHGFITVDEVVRRIYSEIEKNGRVQSDSIKFSLENTTVHEALYDGISNHESMSGYSVESREILILRNGKVGMMDFSYHVEYTPEYDTIPRFDGVHVYYNSDNHYDFARTYFFVRKNGLWGLVYQDKTNIEQVIDCQCETLKSINKASGEKYMCADAGGNVVLFDVSRTKEGTDNRLMFKPMVDGYAIKATDKIFRTDVDACKDMEKSVFVIKRDSVNADYWNKSGHTELYLANITDKTVKIFRETGAVYHLFESQRNSLVCVMKIQDGKKVCNYIDPATNEIKFSFKVDPAAWVREEPYDDPYAMYEDDTYLYGKVTAQKPGESEKIMGYYDFNAKKFSKSKPPRYKKP